MRSMELQRKLFPTIWIAFVLHFASMSASEECKESNETAVYVKFCPRSAKEWKEAASKKGCNNFGHSCSSFEYHCVINAWKNETVEVCAPVQNIVGKVCTEYSFGGSRIQRNDFAGCQSCPQFYYSNESFKYPECYDLVNKALEASRTIVITTSSTLKITTTSENKEFITPSGQERASIHPDSESDPYTKIIIPICAGIASVIVLILICVVYRSDKDCSFIKDTMSRICSFRTRKKQTILNENNNTDIENTPLKEGTTNHCSVKMDPS